MEYNEAKIRMKRLLLILVLASMFFSFNVNAQSKDFYKKLGSSVSSFVRNSSSMNAEDSSNSWRKVSSTVCYSWNGSIKSAANVDVYITSDGNLKVKCNDTFYDMKSNYSYDSNSSNPDYISYYKYYIQIESSKFYLNY